MTQRFKTLLFVASVAAVAVLAMATAWGWREPFPGLWAIVTFILAAFLIELTSNPLHFGAEGSASFVVHLAGGLLFGAFWGGIIAGSSTLVSQAYQRRPLIKVVFNVCQRSLCVAAGVLLYQLLGGSAPPAYLLPGASLGQADSQRDLALFFVFSMSYFAINATALNGVLAITTGRKFQEVWTVNAKGIFGYDIAASSIGLLLAFVYVASERLVGLGALGFVVMLAPILVIRHVYALYRRLQNSGRELLDLMVKAIEARDPYTSGHSMRVATLAKAIAQEAKISAEEVEQVYTAAVLHDVGKIHEEFAPLLRKDSKLTAEETALLQTHSVKSAELVAIISSFRGKILDAVRNHHERWDGGGYPDGLAGEEIPLGARIIMISDTTDAMTTDRPYRKRLPIEAVISELQKHRGTQFDPRLVDMVVSSVTVRRVMAEMQAGHEQQPDDTQYAGGSKRVGLGGPDVMRVRRSWPRIRAF
jgi:putative nucleotidyltransferase with HDIG domain